MQSPPLPRSVELQCDHVKARYQRAGQEHGAAQDAVHAVESVDGAPRAGGQGACERSEPRLSIFMRHMGAACNENRCRPLGRNLQGSAFLMLRFIRSCFVFDDSLAKVKPGFF